MSQPPPLPLPNSGPQNFKEAHEMFASKGQYLVASFEATPKGELNFFGLVPLNLLTAATGLSWQSYLPDADDLAKIRAGKAVTSYVAMPSRDVWYNLMKMTIQRVTIPGVKVPVFNIPTGTYEIPAVGKFDL